MKTIESIASLIALAIMWLMLAIGSGGFITAIFWGVLNLNGVDGSGFNADFVTGIIWGLSGALIASWLIKQPILLRK